MPSQGFTIEDFELAEAPPLPIGQLIYASVASQSFSVAQLRELLTAARLTNARAAVTGLLLYHEGEFLQLLEGPPDAVDTTFWRIERDPRHTAVRVLMRGRVAEREFKGWSMGFLDPGTLDTSLPGYAGFGEDLCLHLLDETRGKRLLKAFREGSLRDRVLV